MTRKKKLQLPLRVYGDKKRLLGLVWNDTSGPSLQSRSKGRHQARVSILPSFPYSDLERTSGDVAAI